MRHKKEAVLPFEFNNDALPKVVREYREKYKGISRVLDEHPEILDMVHKDLKKLSQGDRRGREGDFTSETILRALIVHAIEGDSLRETVTRIADSDFLQDFLRTQKKAVMDYSFLGKCFKAIRPKTWERINKALGVQAAAEEQIDVSVIRTDTTVTETNIHWPTDSSLLWDVYRVAARLMAEGREIQQKSCPHRFHEKKIKGLHLYVTRYGPSKSKQRQRRVKAKFRTLIERAEKIVAQAEDFCDFAAAGNDVELSAIADELRSFLPSMRTIVRNARRAQIDGETVPAAERVFSLFEPHTELIKRGRRNKPVEFGHMVLLCQTREKFITDYDVMAERIPDSELTEKVIDRHEKRFGTPPDVVVGDKGFRPHVDKFAELAERVNLLMIPQRMRDFVDNAMRYWQAFRAGIEGTISGLKRAFRLARCYYRGFKSFAASIGLGVFCHNLIILAQSGGP